MSLESEAAKINSNPQERISFKRKRLLLTIVPNDLPELTPADIVKIRQSVQFTQPEFAQVLGVTRSTLKEWECGRKIPGKSAQHLLYLIEKDKSIVNEFVTVMENDKQTSLLDE